MRKANLVTFLLCPLFTLAVIFTVSFHEVHYLFVDHYEHEHCDNHLHSGSEHGHCSVCKFDVNLFTDELIHPGVANPEFNVVPFSLNAKSVLSVQKQLSTFLRGPPALL